MSIRLINASVLIKYSSDDGYRSEELIRAGKRYPIKLGQSVVPTKAETALLDGIEELARLCALFGNTDEAKKRVDAAFSRVEEFFKQEAQKS